MRRKNHNQKNTGVLTVTADECRGNSEAMVRRFIKRSKKEGIIEEFRSRARFKKPSDVKREKRKELERRIRKENKQKAELFNSVTRGTRKSPRQRR